MHRQNQVMRKLHTLIHSLSTPERSLVFSSLRAVLPVHKGKENKMLKLARFIHKCKTPPSNSRALQAVYGKGEKGTKIFNLEKRLYSRILDSLISETSIRHNPRLPFHEYLAVKIRKLIAQFYFLHHSGKNPGLARQLLTQAEKLSRQNEFFSLLCDCLKLKKQIVGFRLGQAEYEKINSEYKYFASLSEIYQQAVDTYNYTISHKDFQGSACREKLFSWQFKQLSDLQKKMNGISSPAIEYYIKQVEMDMYENKEDYTGARKRSLEWLDIIHDNKSVYRLSRIGSAYDNLSAYEIYLGNYRMAKEHARTAQECFPEGTANYFISLELQFYSEFYNQQFQNAAKLSAQLINAIPGESGKFRYNKYHFLHASALFMQGKIKQAIKILGQSSNLTKDKQGWDIAYRILCIICCIEANDDRGAESYMNALRKRFNEIPPGFLPRFRLIFHAFRLLEKKGFNFEKTSELISLLVTLKSSDKEYKWRPLSPELIPFHQWLSSKIKTHHSFSV